ncbi:MAG: acylphosphatase [Elusimicrobiota bacterium]|jgi:acylphosphatase
MTRQRFVVSGRVQGVGFRWFVHDCAENLGLRGWVRNLSDGTVEAEAEGRPQDLAELFRRLQSGPGGTAQVDKVEAALLPPEGGKPHFDIL